MQLVISNSLSRYTTNLHGMLITLPLILYCAPLTRPQILSPQALMVYYSKMDMLSDDLHMKDEISASKNDRGKAFRRKEEASEMAFHFNAFVPIDGTLWKLDGLERQPQTLGRS